MLKAEPIYLTGYVSKEKLDSFIQGFDEELTLWTAREKTDKEEVELKVPLEWVYRDEEYYYIRWEDFAHQF